jgi:hypothetical protein
MMTLLLTSFFACEQLQHKTEKRQNWTVNVRSNIAFGRSAKYTPNNRETRQKFSRFITIGTRLPKDAASTNICPCFTQANVSCMHLEPAYKS